MSAREKRDRQSGGNVMNGIPTNGSESSIPFEVNAIEYSHPSWSEENGAPFTKEKIKSILYKITRIFSFQIDNYENVYELLMSQLDSRSSRMPCRSALISLHYDYIGGNRSNYKNWYFMAQYELDESISDKRIWNHLDKYKKFIKMQKTPVSLSDLGEQDNLISLDFMWVLKQSKFSNEDYILQLGLYLLIWGEANNIRFLPECVCFIFKCCLDHYYSLSPSLDIESYENSLTFLQDVITPIYKFMNLQQYRMIDGKWIRNNKDHNSIIGYDDINQFFWYGENLSKIKLLDESTLFSYPKEDRILKFGSIRWSSCFYKTFKEKRTWFHLFTNFSRVWIIHVVMYWYYTSYNAPTLYTVNYVQLLDNKPPLQVTLTVISLGGFLSCLISFVATIFEYSFVPRKFPGSQNLFAKLCYLSILTVINVSPSIYVLYFIPITAYSSRGVLIGIIQFVISVITFLYLAVQSPARYFEALIIRSNTNYVKSKTFTSNFAQLTNRGRLFSITLWVCVFSLKFSESYYFLTLSLKDPIRILSILDLSRCRGDVWLGKLLCEYHGKLLLVLLLITDLVLFFLDTYLWYIICNCIFSMCLSFSLGVPIFTPWRNIFVRLPERIQTKLIFMNEITSQSAQNGEGIGNLTSYQSKGIYLVSKIWNSIIISMYKEHLLSLEQTNKLVYQFLESDDFNPYFAGDFIPISTPINKTTIKPPLFFIYQDDNTFKLNDFFTPGKDAERRISFFAQSLSTPIPEPIPTTAMPGFTVLVPHYSEKILLNLRNIIKEDQGSKVSVLDYLKTLNKFDWDTFVQDTKILNARSSNRSGGEGAEDEKLSIFQDKYDELPFTYVGFKNSSYENTLRTRIWSSLRSQTLYRTISGFMNYEKAIKLLYELENTNQITKDVYPQEVEQELDDFVSRKFNLLLTSQRFQKFTLEEHNDARVLFGAFPNIRVSFIIEEMDPITSEKVYYSALLDREKYLKACDKAIEENRPFVEFPTKFKIRLSGNPILGDGKSDNQNHSIIFYRGEYIQVVDANQDNYLEECLKIKSVLADFEEFEVSCNQEYIPGIWSESDNLTKDNQVAIVGAREYIFSENIGVLGDIAAAKEQTFGTLFSRTLAEIGGKLHYGHPDFLNGIFMTTRGGVSKAQKELHLNEDIYAGMMAVCRGGRIKHSDYYQCGKGRDLGFGTILNFTIKIGAGMGEQILSREHYYLGTGLPIDRFLTFYYAHAGFHINNLFISLSTTLFMLVLAVLGSLRHEVILCDYNPHQPITDLQEPLGCYNLEPVLHWVSRFVLSVFICFFISFLPLLFQELIEKGLAKAISRIIYHLVSLSPLFEVFVSQIYSQSLVDNMSLGGAKYIPTGRGFATSRQSISNLFSRYAVLSIYKGVLFSIIIIFATITMWQPSILWFYISFISMSLAPLLFNPHQFSWDKFFIDYKELLHWFSRGNSKWHNSSWYGYQKQIRGRLLGYKKRDSAHLEKKGKNDQVLTSRQTTDIKVPFINRLSDLVLLPSLLWSVYAMSYLFINAQTGVAIGELRRVNPILRIALLAILPVSLNSLTLIITFVISCVLGPVLRFKKFASFIATINHVMAVLIAIIDFEILYYLENWEINKTLLGLVTIVMTHKIMAGVVYLFISKEMSHDTINHTWYSGRWFKQNFGLLYFTQPFREFIIKNIEMICFGYDFLICHLLLFSIVPVLIIPYIDKSHTLMLFWSRTNRFKNPIVSKRQVRRMRWVVFRYSVLFFAMMMTFISLILVPKFLGGQIPNLRDIRILPNMVKEIMAPGEQNHNDTGSNAPLTVLRGRPEPITMRTVP
ncbi:1,3-beta-glucan synthase component Fks3p [[Candida] jaroonii]|uniref:1,3-beta-glucan synthase component Fks3p n=1 Tax=[Candida] jaroonii TaxID=467808 RepID=A0ACA9Y3R1_9ASCO|nr:1,3-beta-glucan synthase component Fks3p [[Candida] jaroonii]